MAIPQYSVGTRQRNKENRRKQWRRKSRLLINMGSQHGHKKAGPKKSHKSGGDSKYVKIPKLKKAPENPFDKFANSKKKHEVINRRVKGEDRNVGKARKNAIESRKNRLQQDYQSTKKTNSFADRRFGESDADLSLEDKMFMRFQKERVKKARNVSLFNLEGGDDVLTHKGQTIGEGNMADDDWHSDDDDDKGGLGRDVVNSLHFGGGMVATKGSNIYGPNDGPEGHGEGDHKAPKNRLDALQEIVAKSKMFKLQKKEAKEEQENDREKLDKDFQALVSGSLLEFRPTKQDRSELKDPNEVIDEYDISLRSMAFEVKARPSDRTKSDEEKAVEARDRLEELEAARLRRMNSDSDPSDNAAADKALNHHGDAKKRKRVTDDEVDGSFGSNFAKDEDDDDDNDDEEKEEEEIDEEDEDDEEEDDDEEDDDDDDEEGEKEDDEEGEEGDENVEVDEDNDEEEDDWEDDDTDPVEASVKKSKVSVKKNSKIVDDQDEMDMEDEDLEEGSDEGGNGDGNRNKKIDKNVKESDEVDELPARKVKKLKKADRAVELLESEGVNNSMPHKINCPSSAEEFDNMTAKYVRTAADLRELVSRILVWSSVHLPGKEGTENRGRMHNFLDVLLKLFVRVGDSLCADKSDEVEIQEQLDFLCMSIFKLGQDVADASPLLWRRTLKLMQSQLQKRLRDFVQGIRDSCWPSLGQLLLLRLSGHVFAVTDFKHAVIGPASLFLCQCLTQCPVRTSKDVASGLLVCSILMSFNEETHRIVPECVEFLRSVVCAFVPSSGVLAKYAPPQRTFDMESPALKVFRECSSKSSLSGSKNEKLRIKWSSFNKEKGVPSDLKTGNCARSFLFTSQLLLSELVGTYTNINAFPEMFAPVLQVLSAVRPQEKPALSKELQASHVTLLESIIRITADRKGSRSALQWRKNVKVSIEVKNPKFQADYTFRKDLDPDENRAKLKQLTRQSKRETKAAMRELRRDSDFIDQLSYAEQEAKKDKLKAERVKNFGWMEEQQASINMQVRKGGEMMTGGGSSIARKARVKR